MTQEKTIDVSVAINELEKKWNNLHPVDRASAVYKLRQAGCSPRQLASALPCSESYVRHLSEAAKAPLPDRIRARGGKISIRQLAQRGKAIIAKERDQNRGEEVRKGCKAICDWLKEEKFKGGWGEQIVGEARRILIDAELSNGLPKAQQLPEGFPLKQIIARTKPPKEMYEDEESVAFYAG